ncbi:MAG: hypothetical protein EOM18_10895, partial [Clostridia bacterium]|nr:hypothetical protein [Clostridia bacterium]
FSTDYFCHKRGLDIFYKLYPELMLEEYMNKGGRHPVRFLLSPYVNARIELLGKCGLGNFSDNFEDLPKANPFAAKAEDLFGVYKQTLRSMNDYHGKNLIIERGFCFIKMIQDYQPAIFEHELTYNSICFLKDYWDENGKRTRMYRSFSKRDVLRAVRFLNGQYLERGSDPEDYDSDDVIWMPYENFRDYQMMCEEMNCYPYGKFPRSTMEAHQAAVYQYIKMYRNDTDKAVEFHRKTTTYKYLKKCWADKKYEIIAPMVLEEMLKEGIEQCSCVASYIDFVLEGISQIYFMRKKDDPGHPLVTIEVRGNVIRQAYGFANRHLDFEEQDFMKRWADEKHLVIRCHGIYTIREYEDLTSMYQYEPMDQYELDLDDVIDMIEEGEDILQKTKSGRTPLFVAVENDDYEVAEYLLNNGASISESVLINGFGIFHESMLPWISPGIMMLLKLHDTDQKFQQICYNGKTPVEFAAGIASDLGQKESFLELDIEVEEEGDGQNEMG